MTSKEKHAYWQGHITGWRQSGASQRTYCEQHELKLSSFTYWRTRLASSKPNSKLIPVTVTTQQAVTLTMASDLQLEIPVALLEQVLPTVLRIMQEAL